MAVSKHSAGAEKSKNKLRKKKQSLEEERAKAREDAVVDISMAEVMTLPSGSNSAGPSSIAPSKEKRSKPPKTLAASAVSRSQEQDADSDDSDANSELDVQERIVDSKLKGKARAVKAFEQRDLVARAFAGDNVVQQFAEQKRMEMSQDAPKEVDTTLTGWVRIL